MTHTLTIRITASSEKGLTAECSPSGELSPWLAGLLLGSAKEIVDLTVRQIIEATVKTDAAAVGRLREGLQEGSEAIRDRMPDKEFRFGFRSPERGGGR